MQSRLVRRTSLSQHSAESRRCGPLAPEQHEHLAPGLPKVPGGRKTASGQMFHQNELTAAHPSLPFGSKVKVTNTENKVAKES